MSTSSHMFATNANSAKLKNTHINRLSIDDIRQFAASYQHALSEADEAKITKLLVEFQPLQQAAALLDKFIDIRIHFQPLKGLSNKKIEKLRKLIAERKKYKDLLKDGKLDPQTYQAFLQNEKMILPLDQIVQWWVINSESLKKEEVWQDIANMTLRENQSHNENQDVTKRRVAILEELKAEWQSHQAFAGFSSENLYEFYHTYTLGMENHLKALLDSKKKYPQTLTAYIENLLKQLTAIKTEIMHSMLYRLQCAEFYLDSRHDDLMSHILDRIDQNCNINIQRKGKKPEPRRSLKPELLAAFIQSIQNHCRQHPNHADLLKKLQKLKMYCKPKSWENRAIPSHLADNPIILFAVNTFPELIQEAKSTIGISDAILNMDDKSKKTFVLNRLRAHLNNAIKEYESQVSSSIITSQDPVATDLRDYEKSLGTLANEIELDLIAIVNKKIEALTESTRNSTKLDYDAMMAAVEHAKKLGEFSKLYLGKRYQPASDIIIAVAHNIRHLITHNKKITPEQCERFASLITTFYPAMDSEQIKELKLQLQLLPKHISSLHTGNASQLLHYLVNYLEKPFLSKRALITPLARHEHLAKQANEAWEEPSLRPEPKTRKQKHYARISTYVSNVTLPLLEAFPTITIDNFDNTTIFVLCEDLKRAVNEPKSELLPAQLNYLRELRSIFEDVVCKKLDDHFSLKDYLFGNQTKTIDLQKLNHLLRKIQNFFSSNSNKDNLLSNISRACVALLKVYFLNLIEHDGTPDMVYLQRINEALGINLLEELCKDEQIRLLLKNYIRTFDGTKSNLSHLLTTLTPIDNLCDCEKYISAYAIKRLDYLKSSRDITQEDYYFYNHYRSMPAIGTALSESKNKFANEISLILKNEQAHWHKNNAKVIELFGENAQVKQYRLKRVLSLLAKEKNKTIDTEMAERLMTDFLNTINYTREKNSSLLDLSTSTESGTTLQVLLDNIISERSWSPLLENIIKNFGTSAQLHRLHAKALRECLIKREDISQSILGRLLNNAAPRLTELKTMGASLSEEVAKLSYEELLDQDSIKALCQELEPLMQSLMAIDKNLNKQDILRSDHLRLKKLIACIKPFAGLYQTYGKDQKIKDNFFQLDEIERKIHLHFELSSVINQHSYIADIAKDDLALHNLIMDLIKSIHVIEEQSLLSDKTIDHYLSICESQILAKIEQSLSIDTSITDFTTLAVLSNLFFHLTSDKLKLLLIHSHKNQILSDPYWLTLINHMDEGKVISTLENTETQHDRAFLDTLRFAQRITRIKHRVNQMIKSHLLREASIPIHISDNIKIVDIIQASAVSDQQLLTLWSICAAKLKKDNLQKNAAPGYIEFICKILAAITTEILKRSITSIELLTKFQACSIELTTIKNHLHEFFSEEDKSSGRYNHLWKTEKMADKILRSLLELQKQGQILHLVQYAEKYALRKIPKSLINEFRKACNDAHFGSGDLSAQVAEIKKIFNISNKKDATKILNTIIICQKFLAITKQKNFGALADESIKYILDNIDQIGVEIKSGSFSDFVSKLRRMSSQPAPSNDKSFPERAFSM